MCLLPQNKCRKRQHSSGLKNMFLTSCFDHFGEFYVGHKPSSGLNAVIYAVMKDSYCNVSAHYLKIKKT